MTTGDPRASGCMGFCGDKNHGEIGRMLHQCYDNQHPDLKPWNVEQIHNRWTRLGKLANAGRL
ncbi:MAG: hypothetical protein EHM35_12900 [Planctomycetaceae bacterium]|nr:MAG: hypothetical protein EHM35_12900 [Planctomycetaceae bacterium]